MPVAGKELVHYQQSIQKADYSSSSPKIFIFPLYEVTHVFYSANLYSTFSHMYCMLKILERLRRA